MFLFIIYFYLNKENQFETFSVLFLLHLYSFTSLLENPLRRQRFKNCIHLLIIANKKNCLLFGKLFTY